MKNMHYASPLKRLVAFFIDCLILIASYMVAGLLLGVSTISFFRVLLPIFGLWWYGGLFLFSWGYFALCESSSLQATVGKRLLGLKVVDLQGDRIGFWRASGRYFGKLLSRLLCFFGFIMILFTKKKQALHDKLTDTLIIQSPNL